MTITWSNIQKWDHHKLDSAAGKLSSERNKLKGLAHDAKLSHDRIQSSGEAVANMKDERSKLGKEFNQRIKVVDDLTAATRQAAEGVAEVQDKIKKCTSFLEDKPYLIIGDDGTVSISDHAFDELVERQDGNNDEATVAEWEKQSQALSVLVKEAVARAVDVDAAYARTLVDLKNGRVKTKEESQKEIDAAHEGRPSLGEIERDYQVSEEDTISILGQTITLSEANLLS